MHRFGNANGGGCLMIDKVASLIATVLVTIWSTYLHAMSFTRHNAESPALNAIAATGKIEAGDSEGLLRYLSTLPKKANTAVYLSSLGGSIAESLKLGYLFKQLRIKTVVEGDRPNNVCASACALAFLGGHDLQGRPWRSSTTNSLLGYHQFYCGDGKDAWMSRLPSHLSCNMGGRWRLL